MRWVWSLRRLVVVIGWVAAAWGVVYAVNGMTQAPATVKVPVTLARPEIGSGWGDVQVDIPGVTVPDGWFAAARPSGSNLVGGNQVGPDGTLTLAAWDSTRVEQLLARGNWLVGGLGILVGALALAPVLGSIADGRPFEHGNARRLVVLAGTIAATGVIAPVLPQVAGILVLERLDLVGARFMDAPSLDPAPVLVGLVVLALAAAFRAGERMADEVSGLV